MERNRILVTGASGQLGWHVCRYLAARGHQVTGSFNSYSPELTGVELVKCDFTDPASIASIAATDYSAVVHAAAMTRPDECQRLPELTSTVNIDATRLLAGGLCPDTRLVYISTDLVFDGNKGHYIETDPIDPVNLYAKSKAEAEQFALSRPGGVVLRMALLYGPSTGRPGGFVSWMKSLLEAGRPVPLFVDQFRTPVYVGDVARAIEMLIEGTPRHHLYHLGGGQRINRFDFGCLYVDGFGYDRTSLQPVMTASAGLVARGKDCSLDSSRFSTEFGLQPATPAEGVQRMKEGVY